MSTTSYNCTTADQRSEGLAHAQRAIAAKQVIVMPTDTVYGIAADAFSAQAVATLLAAKGRGRNMPPPVLMPRRQTMEGLATEIGEDARKLAEKFWPGGLTLIFHAQPSLTWDLGDTHGTVALRVPDDELALDLLTLTGPLAVSSANRTGQPAAQSASEARAQLAESVEVYLEGGFRPLQGTSAVPSTIVDATGLRLRIVREGAISLEQIREVVPSALGLGEEPVMWSPTGDGTAEVEVEESTNDAPEENSVTTGEDTDTPESGNVEETPDAGDVPAAVDAAGATEKDATVDATAEETAETAADGH
ncbi:L-threonylcarbamoyladenylate synthase [Specibacter cremeus]|uniref:L-threonylcarbamoyladenylate synthase n=1 Tax=Specibacter cremeus TaxID=1629051 RepID=UPI000F76DD60|nr:L-threonylcarbamoyladenylate synthase [Specibacter cremeus]